ncbi:MAG: hypothetical protein Q7J24_06045 [Desulfomicrobium sp.]|nr:hypothetical protein [Desulfomicrobium sp.]
MQEIKKPAERGRAFKTGRGGDPKIRKDKVAKNDIYVKRHCARIRLLNPLFMAICCNVSASLESSFLPNWFTQQRGQK